MTPLFSKQGRDSLQRQLQFNRVFGFDLDGTLIPVRRHFEKVKIPKKTKILLENLAQKAKVTVVSGRSIKDLKRILKPVFNLKKITLIGNHGLEGIGQPAKNEVVKLWKKELVKKLRSLPGVIIEDKKLSLTVHYRLTKNPKKARLKILQAIKEFKIRPRIILGDLVFNLLPKGKVNKGWAFAKFMKQNKCHHGFYIGDDWTDEDVFRLNSKKIFTVRVKPLKASKAKFYIFKQSEINKVLQILNNGM